MNEMAELHDQYLHPEEPFPFPDEPEPEEDFEPSLELAPELVAGF